MAIMSYDDHVRWKWLFVLPLWRNLSNYSLIRQQYGFCSLRSTMILLRTNEGTLKSFVWITGSIDSLKLKPQGRPRPPTTSLVWIIIFWSYFSPNSLGLIRSLVDKIISFKAQDSLKVFNDYGNKILVISGWLRELSCYRLSKSFIWYDS